MESDFLNMEIDEATSSLNSDEAVSLIEKFFEKEISGLSLIQKYNNPNGYYGLKYTNEICTILIGSGRGFLDAYVDLEGEKFPLWKLDKKINSKIILNQNNILYILYAIKDFLQNTN